MSVSLFVSIFVSGGLINILLTQAIKQFYYNRGSEASPNIIALIDALVIGGLGTGFVYMLLEIPWSVNNILCLIAMIILVWMGSMLGYSKIIETVRQFRVWQKQIESGQDITEALKELYNDIEDERL